MKGVIKSVVLMKRFFTFLLFNRHVKITTLVILIASFFFSCSPARRIPDDKYLLKKNKLEINSKDIPPEKLSGYIQQRPNKKVLGLRFHLWLYNMANPAKQGWPHGWLRKIGEEPVVYDLIFSRNSSQQLKQYLEDKGFYYAEVKDSTKLKGRNAIVTYTINPNEPYRIRSIRYLIEDTSIVSIIIPDTVNSLIRRGRLFDKELLQKERERIEKVMKELGYYRFSKEYIFYDAKLVPSTYYVDLTMVIKDFVEGEMNQKTKIRPHICYRINNVYIYPDFAPLTFSRQQQETQVNSDTSFYKNTFFVYNRNPKIKYNTLIYRNQIIKGNYYKLSDVEKTYRNYSSLGLFRLVNINFTEDDPIPFTENEKYLNCSIELARKRVQSYQTEIVGTNSSGDFGARGNILYQNWNLFRGAEIFSFRVTGAIESMKNRTKNEYAWMKEIGGDVRLSFPKFLAPLKMEKFVRRFYPKTAITIAYNYQSRPDFTRSIANISYSYNWEGNKYFKHSIWPFEVNYVQIYENRSNKNYLDSMRRTWLGFSFEDHMVSDIRYELEFNSQKLGKSRDYIFTRINLESSGNLVYAANRLLKSDTVDGQYQILNTPYFQYYKGDFDFRYYNIIDKLNKVIYRIYVGLGYPFGNSGALPFEKKFFAGGPNSVRAWRGFELGPGSFTEADTNRFFQYPINKGDIKLEGNFEYRFKVIWKLEGAFFVDAGNIWAIRKEDNRPGALFSWDKFYKEIAVGTGLGFRFDFSFLLIRFDFGIKMRDPAIQDGSRWIDFNNKTDYKFLPFNLGDNQKSRLVIQFGIGYPF